MPKDGTFKNRRGLKIRRHRDVFKADPSGRAANVPKFQRARLPFRQARARIVIRDRFLPVRHARPSDTRRGATIDLRENGGRITTTGAGAQSKRASAPPGSLQPRTRAARRMAWLGSWLAAGSTGS